MFASNKMAHGVILFALYGSLLLTTSMVAAGNSFAETFQSKFHTHHEVLSVNEYGCACVKN